MKTQTDIQKLDKLINGRNTAQKIVIRAKIVRMYLNEKKKKEIKQELKTSRPTIDHWIKRYKGGGIESILKDAYRPGRIPEITETKKKEIIDKTLHTKPKGNVTHWSTRTMAKETGVSKMAVQRLWKQYNIKPHLYKKFKISKDPNFVDKVNDIVGLYMNPPDKAIVMCIDEKSQIQALDRTQPGLPMKKGRLGTMTHDYKRNGTTSLFAALNMLDGKVIGNCYKRHTHKEFIKFLNKVETQTPKSHDLHIVLDNYGTHKTEEVEKWFIDHPRFKRHFTPTSSSWINMVERFFSEITNKMIRRGNFRSEKELKDSIKRYLKEHNNNPKTFKWTKDADTIISKVNKCKEALGALH